MATREVNCGIRCDPTWNHLARTVLVYVLPLALLALCLHRGWVGWSRDFWVPFIWGAIIPTWNTRRAEGRPWALTDYMNRDGFPILGMSLVHATLWCVSVNALHDALQAMLAFIIAFHVFDALMLHYRILRVYAIPLALQKRGILAVLLSFGVGWWTYLAGGLALAHVHGHDTLFSIVGWSLVIIAPAQMGILLFERIVARPERLDGVKRVAVIGAGWAGLYAIKWLKELGLEPVCFEASDDIGGVWRYRENVPGGVFKNTRVTSSKHFLHASDFPMPEELPDFPHHAEIMSYLRSYADHFGLLDHVHLSTCVEKLERVSDGWQLWVRDEAERREQHFDAVMVCSGPQGIVRVDSEAHVLYSRFDGALTPAEDYKHPGHVKPGEQLLIVGAGESAADIVAEIVEVGAHVHWSMHRGQWFADRNIGPNAADLFTATGFRALAGRFMMVEYLIRHFIIAPFIHLAWGRGGHGIKSWIPTTLYLHQFLNKSRDAILQVYRRAVTPHGRVVDIRGKEIHFEGEDQPITVDRILLASGYRPHWPFLAEQPRVLFKKVFLPEDPTLAFIGFARPVLGSFPSLAELHARWAANVFAGRALPCRARRVLETWMDQQDHARRYLDSSTLGILTDQETHASELARYVGAQVPWLKLLFTNPGALWVTLWSPWIAFKYHLNDPDPQRRRQAAENIRRELPHWAHPCNLLSAAILVLAPTLLAGIAVAVALLPLQIVAGSAAALLFLMALFFRWTDRWDAPQPATEQRLAQLQGLDEQLSDRTPVSPVATPTTGAPAASSD